MGSEERELPAAGWYHDPEGRAGVRRYWDGEQWTDRYQGGADEKRHRTLRIAAGTFFVVACLVAVLGTVGVIAAAIEAGDADSTVFGEQIEGEEGDPAAIAIFGGLAVFLYSIFFFAAAGVIRLLLEVDERTRRTAAVVESFAAGR